jgi:Uma2 family endonuclease
MSAITEPSSPSDGVGLTWEAFLELPEELLEHAELHDGEVVEMASPGRPHQLALVRLIVALDPWVRVAGGEIVPDPHVKITARRGYQPDLAWYAADRVPTSGYWTQPPNLVVEILSPSTRRRDVLRKPTDYFMVGVQEMWMIDLDEQAVVAVRPQAPSDEFLAGDTLTSPLLAGFQIAVSDLIVATS